MRFNQYMPLFICAIDCPGYGKSTGDKQTIRSYPTKFLKEIMLKLNGSTKAFILSGHSQGGCAVFNSIIEDNNIADFLVQDRPVFGQIPKLR